MLAWRNGASGARLSGDQGFGDGTRLATSAGAAGEAACKLVERRSQPDLPLARQTGTAPLGRGPRLGALSAGNAGYGVGSQLEPSRANRLQRLVE
jgi:hypothetical protein